MPALRADTALHQASSAVRSQRSLTLMPSANLIQSAKRCLGTAITTGISALSALDQVGQALALTFLPSEPVDDHEVGALIDRVGDLGAGVEQLADIQPAAGRAGPEVLK